MIKLFVIAIPVCFIISIVIVVLGSIETSFKDFVFSWYNIAYILETWIDIISKLFFPAIGLYVSIELHKQNKKDDETKKISLQESEKLKNDYRQYRQGTLKIVSSNSFHLFLKSVKYYGIDFEKADLITRGYSEREIDIMRE